MVPPPTNLIGRPTQGPHFGSTRAKIIKYCGKTLRDLHAKQNFVWDVLHNDRFATRPFSVWLRMLLVNG